MKSDARAYGLLTFLLLVTTLPFVHRAYFVDDFYFVTMAKGILQHPTRPYDFLSDDAGIANVAWERGKQPRMVNPPLFHYFLAAVIKTWGDDVWKLRTASLIFPWITLVCVYLLGRRFIRDSLAAASLLAVTPAFWLTSYSLLLDSALVAFLMAALTCFIFGHERNSMKWWILSGFFIGCTLLTKYTGFLIYPVMLMWHWLHRDRCSIKGTVVTWTVSFVLFVLWGVWGIAIYGQPHFTATLSRGFHPAPPVGVIGLGLIVGAAFLLWLRPMEKRTRQIAPILGLLCVALWTAVLTRSASIAGWLQTFYLDKMIGVASFLGGTTVFAFFTLPMLWQRSRKVFTAVTVVALVLFVVFASRLGGFNLNQSLTLMFFILAAAGLLLVGLSHITPDAPSEAKFLLGWLIVGLIELIVVMPWTAARYFLIVLPAAVWIFRYVVEQRGYLRLWKLAWVTSAVMGLALAYVDLKQAQVIVPLGERLGSQREVFQSIAPRPQHRWFYLADTFDGSQPYIQSLGWENVFPFQEFPKGSLFLRSHYRKSSWWNIPNPERFQPIMVWEFDSKIPLRVMDIPAAAGFYASCWGILPYAFTRHPLERFELYLVN
jgi:hypothetical protein